MPSFTIPAKITVSTGHRYSASKEVYGGTQTALIILTVEAAKRAIIVSKVKIQKKITLKKYFRHLKFRYIAKSCTSAQGKPELCRKCAKKGHMASEYAERPKFLFCRHIIDIDSPNIAGSNASLVYKVYAQMSFLQLNLNHCQTAQNLFTKYTEEKNRRRYCL